MKKFTKLTIKETPATETKSTFLVKNLEKGFGITIGNALRRVLLSNIPGASMFAVKISGIKHEFESIPGIKEDAINLVLNLKKLVIVISEESYSDEDLNNLKIES
jgi:DNA-directed RNA polymerase subunit alpha